MTLITRARAEHGANGRSLRYKALCMVIGALPARDEDECEAPANAHAMRPHIFGEPHDAPANGR